MESGQDVFAAPQPLFTEAFVGGIHQTNASDNVLISGTPRQSLVSGKQSTSALVPAPINHGPYAVASDVLACGATEQWPATLPSNHDINPQQPAALLAFR
jgi:hypothetical protein